MSETEEGGETFETRTETRMETKTETPVVKKADLSKPFSVGNVKVIESTPGHKAPTREDNIEGRYAGVLFTAASQKNQLFKCYEDMKFIGEMYDNSESFRMFTQNQAVGKKENAAFADALRQMGDFQDTTFRLVEVLIENRRFKFIKKVADSYLKLYQTFNKEEKITIISATDLTDSEKGEVAAALKQNPQNQGKEFVIEYQQDAAIMGGLQMYTESEFMDMSLQSRLDRVRIEVNRISTGL